MFCHFYYNYVQMAVILKQYIDLLLLINICRKANRVYEAHRCSFCKCSQLFCFFPIHLNHSRLVSVAEVFPGRALSDTRVLAFNMTDLWCDPCCAGPIPCHFLQRYEHCIIWLSAIDWLAVVVWCQ